MPPPLSPLTQREGLTGLPPSVSAVHSVVLIEWYGVRSRVAG